MKMIIESKTYGKHTVYFDDEDLPLIKQYKWGIWKSKTGKPYAVHSWKRGDEEVAIKMHRLVMGIEKSRYPLIDHRNGDTLNNKKENLRIATHSQNSMNIRKKSKSGFKGVSRKSENSYVVAITVGGRTHLGGSYPTAIDAAKSYDEMARKYHGEFAHLNFPDPIVKSKEHDELYVQPIAERKRYNSTGFRGVCIIQDAVKNKFRAYISINGKRVELGCYPDPSIAAKAYDTRAKEVYGERAVLNFN